MSSSVLNVLVNTEGTTAQLLLARDHPTPITDEYVAKKLQWSLERAKELNCDIKARIALMKIRGLKYCREMPRPMLAGLRIFQETTDEYREFCTKYLGFVPQFASHSAIKMQTVAYANRRTIQLAGLLLCATRHFGELSSNWGSLPQS